MVEAARGQAEAIVAIPGRGNVGGHGQAVGVSAQEVVLPDARGVKPVPSLAAKNGLPGDMLGGAILMIDGVVMSIATTREEKNGIVFRKDKKAVNAVKM